MKAKITRNVKRIISLVLTALFLVSVPTMETQAAELYAVEKEEVEVLKFVPVEKETLDRRPSARTTIFNCIIDIYCSSDGMLVEVTTDCLGTASVIGVKDIKIQKKVWYGWKTVATSEGGARENGNTYAGSILYTGAEYGETYRVSCVHYADVDGYEEGKNVIDSFVFTY